jgi:hypothetical protein
MQTSPGRAQQPSIPLWVSLPALALLIVVGVAVIWANKDNTPAARPATSDRAGIDQFDHRAARPTARLDTLETPAPQVWEVPAKTQRS